MINCVPLAQMVGAVSTLWVRRSLGPNWELAVSYTKLSRKHWGAFPEVKIRQLIATHGRSAASNFRVSTLSLSLTTLQRPVGSEKKVVVLPPAIIVRTWSSESNA